MKSFTKEWDEMLEKEKRGPLEEQKSDNRWLALFALFVVVGGFILTMAVFGFGMFFILEHDQYAVVVKTNAESRIYDAPGYYFKWPIIEKVYYYPRYIDVVFSSKNDRAIRCNFNDGETANIGLAIKAALPIDAKRRWEFHIVIRSIKNLEGFMHAHANFCVRASTTVMSLGEALSIRREELRDLIIEQFINGLYTYDVFEVKHKDGSTHIGTEVVKNELGEPVMAKGSYWDDWGIKIQNVSIVEISYSSETNRLLQEAKKRSLQAL